MPRWLCYRAILTLVRLLFNPKLVQLHSQKHALLLCCQYSRGRVLLCRSSLLHPPIKCEQYVASKDRSPGRRGKRVSFLSSHLWSGSAGLSARSSQGTNVPLPFTHGKCVPGQPPGHSSSGAYHQRGIFSHKFPPDHPGSNHTLPRDQTTLSANQAASSP